MAIVYWPQVSAAGSMTRICRKVSGPMHSRRSQAHLVSAQWTTIVQSVGMNTNLARVGFNHGLDACVNRDPATPIVSEKMMAATVEAILGAVHLDGGNDALATVMEHLGLSHELLSQVVTFIALLS